MANKEDNRLGGYIPRCFLEITQPFYNMRWNKNSRTSFKTIREAARVPLNEKEKVFIDFPETALYSPVSYLPQSLAIFVLRKLNINPLIIFYGARIFTLLIWILGIWYAIHITPIYKWLFVLLALMPMSIYINMSLSADVVTNILSFLLFAFIFKAVFEEKEISMNEYLILVFLTIMLSLAKIAYTPLILLFALIPVKRFRDFKRFSLHYIILLVIGFGTAFLWSRLATNWYIPSSEYNPLYRNTINLPVCSNVHDQMDYILEHGLYIFNVFFSSLSNGFNMYYESYIGTFGGLDTHLPRWVIHIAYFAILIVAVFEPNHNASFSNVQRLFLLLTLIISVFCIILSLHLVWDCIGSEYVSAMQGKYFIPLFPLLFFQFTNSNFSNQMLTKITIIFFSILILLLSVKTLYSRYYVYPKTGSISIYCNAEEISEDGYFITSDPDIHLENADTRNDEYSRSGNYSARLDSIRPFGFTYRYFNGEIGDEILVEVWRYGISGDIMIAGSEQAFSLMSSEVTETDHEGWDKLQSKYTLQKNMQGREIGFFIYNTIGEPSYFDDLSIFITKIDHL